MHFISAKQRDILRKSLTCHHVTGEELSCRATLTEKKDVLHATCVLLPVRLTVLHFSQQMISDGRRYPEFFRINFSRCIFCGFCEEACPTYAIQLIPDFEMGEYDRQNMVYEKENLLISGEGKYHGYNFYKVAGVDMGVKDIGEGENEEPPVDLKSLIH